MLRGAYLPEFYFCKALLSRCTISFFGCVCIILFKERIFARVFSKIITVVNVLLDKRAFFSPRQVPKLMSAVLHV